MLRPGWWVLRGLLNYTSCMAILACLLWSSAFAGIKIGLLYTTPLHFAGVRFMLAGLLVLPFCGNIFSTLAQIRAHLGTVLIIAFFQTTFLYSLFYLGLDLLPGAVAAIVIGTQPLVVAGVAHFFAPAERMTTKKAVSLLFGGAGVLAIAANRGEIAIEGPLALLGIGLLLLSNFSGAASNLLVARKTMDINPLVLNSAQLIIGGGFLFLLSKIIEDRSLVNYEAPYFVSLAWLSFLSAAALSIWFQLLKRDGVRVSDLNIWKFLIPLAGACLSWLLVEGESPTPGVLAGMCSIVVALLVLNINGRFWRTFKKKHDSH